MTLMKSVSGESRPVAIGVFMMAVLLAMLNPDFYQLLIGLWSVIGSIICPLIVTILPATFFYYILSDTETSERKQKVYHLSFAISGLIILPIYLFLST